MCENKTLFSNFDDWKGEIVIFGDGAITPILSKGTIHIPGLPTVSNVLSLESLNLGCLALVKYVILIRRLIFFQKKVYLYDTNGNVL